MSETDLTSAQITALQNTTDSGSDFEHPDPGENYAEKGTRNNQKLLMMTAVSDALRVFKDGTLTYGVRAGAWMNGETLVDKDQADEQSLEDGQTNYIYYTPSGTLTDNITGWPAAAHIKLATILTAGGTFAYTDVTDYRASNVIGVQGELVSMRRAAVHACGAVYFSGRPADDELLTIGGRKYEMDDDANFPQSGGDVQCDLSGNANVDDDITDIAAAINGDSSATWNAVADTANDVLWLYADDTGTAGNSITLVEALTNATVSNATFVDGANAGIAAVVALRHTITAGEAAGGFISIGTGLSSIEMVQVTFEDAGNVVASQVDVTVSDGNVTLAENGAAWATDDVLNILIIGTE